MKLVKQTKLGPSGNCLNACVAMITGIPLSQIPTLSNENDKWLSELKDYLSSQGWLLSMLGTAEGGHTPVNTKCVENYMDVPIIVTGHTVRNGKILHAVVFYKNDCYDPHPDDTGIIDIVDFIILSKAPELLEGGTK